MEYKGKAWLLGDLKVEGIYQDWATRTMYRTLGHDLRNGHPKPTLEFVATHNTPSTEVIPLSECEVLEYRDRTGPFLQTNKRLGELCEDFVNEAME